MNALFHKQCPSNVVPVNYYSTIPPYNYRGISSNSYLMTSSQSNAFQNQIVYPTNQYITPINKYTPSINQLANPSNLLNFSSNQAAPIVYNQFAASQGISANYPISYRGLNIIMISSLVLLSLDLIFVRPLKHRIP